MTQASPLSRRIFNFLGNLPQFGHQGPQLIHLKTGQLIALPDDEEALQNGMLRAVWPGARESVLVPGLKLAPILIRESIDIYFTVKAYPRYTKEEAIAELINHFECKTGENLLHFNDDSINESKFSIVSVFESLTASGIYDFAKAAAVVAAELVKKH